MKFNKRGDDNVVAILCFMRRVGIFLAIERFMIEISRKSRKVIRVNATSLRCNKIRLLRCRILHSSTVEQHLAVLFQIAWITRDYTLLGGDAIEWIQCFQPFL